MLSQGSLLQTLTKLYLGEGGKDLGEEGEGRKSEFRKNCCRLSVIEYFSCLKGIVCLLPLWGKFKLDSFSVMSHLH